MSPPPPPQAPQPRATGLLLRSKLFVPGSRPELFTKALAGAADALSFDLEDAVAEARKAQARHAVRDWLLSGAHTASGKTLIVRINRWGGAHAAEDLRAVALPGLHMVNLPKPSSAAEVVAVAHALAEAEAANGVTQPIGLLLTIETPSALRQAHELAGADPRVLGLQLGLADLFEPLGIARRDPGALAQARFALRLAAGEAGVWACDAAFADLHDEAGYRADALHARNLGYIGKSCVHPHQVALANAVFSPTADELAHAQVVLAAAGAAEAQGVGVLVANDQMVDAPFVQRARDTVAAAARLGLLP